jgi:hypothetical protein
MMHGQQNILSVSVDLLVLIDIKVNLAPIEINYHDIKIMF